MDFLLLLRQRRRIVLVEVDGRHNYATENGTADPQQYARMLAEDRRLRLAGNEVYRFGGAELSDEEHGRTLLKCVLRPAARRSPAAALTGAAWSAGEWPCGRHLHRRWTRSSSHATASSLDPSASCGP